VEEDVKDGTTMHAFTRNDVTGAWVKSVLYSGRGRGGNAYSVRDLHVHRDRVTGVDRVFATFGNQGIFSAVYDPEEPGLLRWESEPEMGPLEMRPMAITEVNGALVFSSGAKVYQRIDGERPEYRIVHDLSDLPGKINASSGGIRGLTAVPNPTGSNESLLLVWNPMSLNSGIIYRLDPGQEGGFSRHLEVKLPDLMSEYLGRTQALRVGAGHSHFLPIPRSNGKAKEYMVGFQTFLEPNSKSPAWPENNPWVLYRGAVYAIRDADQNYRLEEVGGRITADRPPLVTTRCYAPSPFRGENAIYFGGLDTCGLKATNRAWVYKKVLVP
jgi:hypothetical protein